MAHRSWLAWAGAALAAVALIGMGCSGPGVQRVTIVGGDLDLGLLEQRQLAAVVTATGGVAATVDWAADDPSVVTVTADGLLTAVDFGAAQVTATSTHDPSKDHTIEVRVGLTGGHVWTHQFGTAEADFAWGIAVHVDGSIVVAGATWGTLLEPAPPPPALFVRKLASDGTPQWTHGVGPVDYPLGGVAVGSDGRTAVVATTYTSLDGQPHAGGRDAFVQVLDGHGAPLWSRQFGTAANDTVAAVAIGADGRVIVAGSTDGALDGQPHSGGTDGYLRSFDQDGVHLWTRQFGTAATDWVAELAVGGNGHAAVVGRTAGGLDGEPNAGGDDAFVRVVDAAGVHLWTHLVGTAERDHALGVAIDPHGHVLVVGLTRGVLPGQAALGSDDAFVRKLAPDGTVVWTRQFGSDAEDSAWGVAVDHEGYVLVAGYTLGALPDSVSAGGTDGFVRKLDPDGQGVWTQQFGTPEDDFAWGIAVDASGFVAVSGFTEGGLAAPHAGAGDAFVRRLRP